jgi:hypothetical protein
MAGQLRRDRRVRYVLWFVLVVVLVAATAVAAGVGSAARATPPKNTDRPTLSGTPQVGQTLTATNGSWTSATTIQYVYRFLRCDKNGGGCYSGGTTKQKTYTVTASDVGNTIRVRVTATNTDGSTSADSAPTAVVKAAAAPPTPASSGCPSGTGTADVAKVDKPARLTVDRQDISPPVIGRSTQQLQVRFHVGACNGRSVQGALVYVTAVPFSQFSIPPETATGSDGWATLTMTQLSGFPAANRQQLLVLFVRARKPGDDVLGGISTRRLVSFRVDLNR